jgi:hypothetical protein
MQQAKQKGGFSAAFVCDWPRFLLASLPGAHIPGAPNAQTASVLASLPCLELYGTTNKLQDKKRKTRFTASERHKKFFFRHIFDAASRFSKI